MPADLNWFHEGVMAFNDGERRLMPNCLFLHDNWTEKARQWYAGWDSANMAAPVEYDD